MQCFVLDLFGALGERTNTPSNVAVTAAEKWHISVYCISACDVSNSQMCVLAQSNSELQPVEVSVWCWARFLSEGLKHSKFHGVVSLCTQT